MKKKIVNFLTVVLLQVIGAICLVTCSVAQSIGIGTSTPNSSSVLDLSSPGKGLLIPRMTTSGITSISSPAKGLMIYDSTKNQLMVNMGSSGTPQWQTIVFKSGWSLNGNSGVNAGSLFIGTIDSVPLSFRVNNKSSGRIDVAALDANTFFGYQAGTFTTGSLNAAFGMEALYSNTSGNYNTAFGAFALSENSTGATNTAIGAQALTKNTTGGSNTAIGMRAMSANTTGYSNTATGSAAMIFNTTGFSNTAAGHAALRENSTGSNNTAIGSSSLFSNQGSYNTATGATALYENTTGFHNTASGAFALRDNLTGNYNTADGSYALVNNTTGNNNTAMGYAALQYNTTQHSNTCIGYLAGWQHVTGSANTLIGASADIIFDNQTNSIAIGYNAVVDANNKARIGSTTVTSIGGQVGWSTFSDGRYKKIIKEDIPGITFINRLRPVSYTVDIKGLNEKYYKLKDPNSETSEPPERQTGFIAQEVEDAARELGFRFSGIDKPHTEIGLYGLRYAEFVVPLVKAVQELSKQNDELQKQNHELLKRIDRIETLLKIKTALR